MPVPYQRVANEAIVVAGLFLVLLANGFAFGDDTIDSNRSPLPFEFVDVLGKKVSTRDLSNNQAMVLVFVTTDCPIANSYQPALARMYQEFQKKGFVFVLVHEGPEQATETIENHTREYAVPFFVALDPKHSIAQKFGATTTPEVCVLNKKGERLYLGRIDDLHQGFGKKRFAATREDLKIALMEIASGAEVSVPTTKAVGCLIPSKR